MRAYSIAKQELSALRELYWSSLYAFTQTETVLQNKFAHDHNRVPSGPTQVSPQPEIITPIVYRLKKSFRNRIRRQLRELVFIRLVSVLEAYLVDTVRDVFFITKEPFKDQTAQVNFTQAEILSTASMSNVFSKIINKECRRLTSGGFMEILKFYRTRFEIDLMGISPGKKVMTEYHERRHLLVHRLGKPDNQYRRTYAFTKKQVTVDESYLEACFNDFDGFIEHLNAKFADKLTIEGSFNRTGSPQPSVSYEVALRDENAPAIFDEDFQFWVEDEIYTTRDILKNKKYLSPGRFELTLTGTPEALRAYSRYLRRAEKNGHVTVTVRERNGFKGVFKGTLDESLISQVQESLPEQPWPQGIHKQIAEQLGLSNGRVSYAIQILIQRGVFRHQINGVILDNAAV